MPKPWRKFLNDADDYVLSHIYALEGNSVNDLFAEYERAYHRMAIGLEALQRQYGTDDTWSATDAFYRVRTEKLLAQIAQEMQGLSNASQDMVLKNAMQSYYAGYLGRAWVSETLAGQDLTMALLPTTAVRAAILKPYEGSTFVDRFKTNEADFQARIRKSIVQSQIEGETIFQAQKRIANELGLNIDRRRKADKQANQGHFNRIQMIARTEILRTSNLGAVAFYQQNDDVLKGWEWRATQDARTCPVCGNLDGRVFSFEDKQNPPPAHPSCRCSATPAFLSDKVNNFVKVRSFKEWVAQKNINTNIYGQAYTLKPQKPPKSPGVK